MSTHSKAAFLSSRPSSTMCLKGPRSTVLINSFCKNHYILVMQQPLNYFKEKKSYLWVTNVKSGRKHILTMKRCSDVLLTQLYVAIMLKKPILAKFSCHLAQNSEWLHKCRSIKRKFNVANQVTDRSRVLVLKVFSLTGDMFVSSMHSMSVLLMLCL